MFTLHSTCSFVLAANNASNSIFLSKYLLLFCLIITVLGTYGGFQHFHADFSMYLLLSGRYVFNENMCLLLDKIYLFLVLYVSCIIYFHFFFLCLSLTLIFLYFLIVVTLFFCIWNFRVSILKIKGII